MSIKSNRLCFFEDWACEPSCGFWEGFSFGLDFSSDYESVFKTFLGGKNIKLNDFFFMGYKTKKGVFMVVVEIGI